ncbi:hypothetical protein [Paraglaciecola sp. MB-3u-78]|jgi:hypothetical protein|uniref:hypothetical protein n=1 Tax=Paraglaciecola sp. MB-3u-78 TaxID=2058332 RepID=UPI000C34A38B|nr:hypothetical protein [Paraglaciecola sp. MB-3u-78]PKG93204.1 hypothetical protein CXF95_26855 [Paraglaciecola sp. MB-3u-78]
MKLLYRTVIALAVLFSSQVNATIIQNPVPGVYSEDIDGTGYFSVTGTSSFLTEILDIGEAFGLVGNVFGFYFEGADVTDTNNLHVVFDQTDAKNNQAVINLNNNIVIDVDNNSIQSVFTGAGDIGFFVFLPSFGNQIFFSDASLNVGGDFFGSFQNLNSPSTYALLFASPQTNGQIELTIAGPLTPIQRVSAPSVFMLLLLAGIWQLRRKSLEQLTKNNK